MKKMLSFDRQGFDSFIAASYETLVTYYTHVKRYEADAALDMVHDFAEWGMNRDWQAWADDQVTKGKQPKFDLIDAKLTIGYMNRDAKQRTVESSVGFIPWSVIETLQDGVEAETEDGGYHEELVEVFQHFDINSNRKIDRIVSMLTHGDTPERILSAWQEYWLNEDQIPNRIAKLSPQQAEIMGGFEAEMKSCEIAEALGIARNTLSTQLDRACEKIYCDEPHLRPVHRDWKEPTQEEMDADVYLWNGLLRSVHAVLLQPRVWWDSVEDKTDYLQAAFENIAYGLERTNAAAKFYRGALNNHGVQIALALEKCNNYTPRQPCNQQELLAWLDETDTQDAERKYYANNTRLFNILGLGKNMDETTLSTIIQRLGK